MFIFGFLVYRSFRNNQLESRKAALWKQAQVTPDIIVRMLIFSVCPLAALMYVTRPILVYSFGTHHGMMVFRIGLLQYLPWNSQNYGSGLNIALATRKSFEHFANWLVYSMNTISSNLRRTNIWYAEGE